MMDAIKTRRSVRRFKPAPEPDSLLNEVLNAARLAPSACNSQQWRISSLNEDKVRKVLAMPEDVRVVAMNPLGFPDEVPERTPRTNFEELIRYDKYQ